jgi:hypothetical protein
VDDLADDFEGVQTHLFEVGDDQSDHDDDLPGD